MRFLKSLCPPALLYLIFLGINVVLDVLLGMYWTAAVKSVFGGATVLLLDALCGIDLGIVSWAIVATPFIVTALATAISMGIGADRKLIENFSSKPVVTEESKDEPSAKDNQSSSTAPF